MHHAAHFLRRRLAGVALVTGLALAFAASFAGQASAATSPGCNFQTHTERLIRLWSFQHRIEPTRAAFFRKHRRTRARRLFVAGQHAMVKTLKHALARCTGSTAVPEGTANPPAPCSPSLYSAPFTENNEGTTNVRLPLRPEGRISAVMLFVDWPDLHATNSAAQIFNGIGPRAKAWYHEVSYGHVALDIAPVEHWYSLPGSVRDYGLGGGLTFGEQRDYMRAAVAAADQDVDFSKYQVLFVVAAKGSPLDRSPAFHAYPGDGISVDGTELRYGSTLGEDIYGDNVYGSHVLAHETGHVLGLPDLYDVPRPVYWSLFRYAGGWDMMSWNDPGAHFFAWEKWKLGWLDPSQLTCLDAPGELTATITPLERAGGLKAIVIPTSASTAYVVEARRRIGQDARLCESGVLVYSVDATVRTGDGPIRVHPAQRDRDPDLINQCGPLYNAPFDSAKGEVAKFEDAAAGISMQVLASGTAGYKVRVARTSVVPQGLAISAPTGGGSEESFSPPQFSFPFGVGWDLNPNLAD